MMLKNEKGISGLVLCIVIIIIIIFLVVVFNETSENDYNVSTSTSTSSSVSKPKEDRSTYISKCTTIDYTSLARNPNQYKGNYYTFTGEVIQVLNDGNDVTLRVNVTPKRYTYSNETYYEDTILVSYTYSNSYESRILEDDIITIYGQSIGTYTYEAITGAPITVPAIIAGYIDIN